MSKTKENLTNPREMQVLISKLFGDSSKVAHFDSLSEAQYKNVLAQIVNELYYYMNENIKTDQLHREMLLSGLYAAKEALKEKDFYLGYIAGILRFSLLLMGEYPDHRKRKRGRKNTEYYKLNLLRSVTFTQDYEQVFRTILAAGNTGFPELSINPRQALDKFRDEYGTKASHRDFIEWYKINYPSDYAVLF
jgi:hypothetical protein